LKSYTYLRVSRRPQFPGTTPPTGVPTAEGADDDDVPDLLPAWYFGADIIAGGQTGAETIMVQMTMNTMNTSSRITGAIPITITMTITPGP
jgi:hypothetical protein